MEKQHGHGKLNRFPVVTDSSQKANSGGMATHDTSIQALQDQCDETPVEDVRARISKPVVSESL